MPTFYKSCQIIYLPVMGDRLIRPERGPNHLTPVTNSWICPANRCSVILSSTIGCKINSIMPIKTGVVSGTVISFSSCCELLLKHHHFNCIGPTSTIQYWIRDSHMYEFTCVHLIVLRCILLTSLRQ